MLLVLLLQGRSKSTMGILGTGRRKQMVPRKSSRLCLQVFVLHRWWKNFRKQDTQCSSGKPAGPRDTEEENIRDTIHFNGKYCNIDLLCRTAHSTNQLCIYGAVAKCCGKTLADMKVLAKDPEKFKSSNKISSH